MQNDQDRSGKGHRGAIGARLRAEVGHRTGALPFRWGQRDQARRHLALVDDRFTEGFQTAISRWRVGFSRICNYDLKSSQGRVHSEWTRIAMESSLKFLHCAALGCKLKLIFSLSLR
jgi:hypothetical protein